jgi:hypothetical protein
MHPEVQRGIRMVAAGAIVVFFARQAISASPAAFAAPPAHTCTWTIEHGLPFPKPLRGYLDGVDSTGANDVWAVGVRQTTVYEWNAFAEHWDGALWTGMTLPVPPRFSFQAVARGIVERAWDDVWVVGEGVDISGIKEIGFVDHWDGTSWRVVLAARWIYPRAIAAVAGTDQLWVVGRTRAATLVEHFDGSSWIVVPSPSPGFDQNVLLQVSASSPTDAWATGGGRTQGGQNFEFGLHWDGSAWSIAGPPGGGVIADLSSTDALSAGDDFERWDGSAWNVVLPDSGGAPYGIEARSESGAWAVGLTRAIVPDTYAAHWDGAAWTIAKTPNVPESENALYSVTFVPGSNTVWAVGVSVKHGKRAKPLIERSC